MRDENAQAPATTPAPMEKGYTPAPADTGWLKNGFIPAAGSLGTPPTQGSAVSKPEQSKK